MKPAGQIGFAALVPLSHWKKCGPDDEGAVSVRATMANVLGQKVQRDSLLAAIQRDEIIGSAADEPATHARRVIEYVLHHNRRIYRHEGEALRYANTGRRFWGDASGEEQPGKAALVEIELLEPVDLDLQERFEFAERMIQFWAERAEKLRKDMLDGNTPAPKKKRKPPPVNPLTGRPITRRQQRYEAQYRRTALVGYLPGCRLPQHLDGQACDGGCDGVTG